MQETLPGSTRKSFFYRALAVSIILVPALLELLLLLDTGLPTSLLGLVLMIGFPLSTLTIGYILWRQPLYQVPQRRSGLSVAVTATLIVLYVILIAGGYSILLIPFTLPGIPVVILLIRWKNRQLSEIENRRKLETLWAYILIIAGFIASTVLTAALVNVFFGDIYSF